MPYAVRVAIRHRTPTILDRTIPARSNDGPDLSQSGFGSHAGSRATSYKYVLPHWGRVRERGGVALIVRRPDAAARKLGFRFQSPSFSVVSSSSISPSSRNSLLVMCRMMMNDVLWIVGVLSFSLDIRNGLIWGFLGFYVTFCWLDWYWVSVIEPGLPRSDLCYSWLDLSFVSFIFSFTIWFSSSNLVIYLFEMI